MSEAAQLAEIYSITSLTAHTKQLVLRPLEHHVAFQPGQWVSLQLPIGDRPPLNRAYSLADPPSTSGHLSLVFDQVPGGKASNYLAALRPGDRFPVSGPYGRFVLPNLEGKRLLLIGRYSGLVPLRCIVRSLVHRGELPPTVLIAQAPSASEQLYHEEFQALADTNPGFRYISMVQEHAADHDAVAATIRKLVDGNRSYIPMIAGVKAFARPLREVLIECGYERREVRIETYD